MALDEGVELESVKKPLGEAGDILGLWQDDESDHYETSASDATRLIASRRLPSDRRRRDRRA